MAKIVYGKREDLSKKIANQIVATVNQKENAILCLPTGNSPVAVYNSIVDSFKNKKVSFKNVTTYNLDEYLDIDPVKDPVSFKNFMKTNLFDHIDIDQSKTNFPSTPESYNEKLDSFKSFDYTLLGVGVNGHIAFNEPGTTEDKRTNIVTLTESTIKANFPGMDKFPTRAITMGLKDIIFKSKKIVIMAWGDSKADAIRNFLKGQKDNKCPITLLSNLKNVEIWTDIKEFKPNFFKRCFCKK